LKNTEDNSRILEKCLKALDLIFTDQYVEIDTSVFNPSRVSKLYGSTAQKGSDTKERPHRMARIITKPDKVEQVKKEQLEKLASEYVDSQPVQKTSKSSSFDIEGWIEEHGIRVARVDTWKDTTKYVLEECPFDSNHKAPDSTIIKQSSGAIAFKCFHNSCSGHDWRELRLMFEPDAYDDKTIEENQRIEDGWKAYKAFNRQRTDIEYKEAETPENPSDMFLSAKQILALPKEERICIPTGLKEFDKRVGGLAKGEITLVSGMRGAAKSTWLSQVVLGAINNGFSTLVYSGELKNERFMNWLFQQAAGKDHVERSKKYNDFWYCKNEVKPKIAEWLDGKFFLYNNNYGSNFRQIAEVLQKVIKNYRSDLVIIDNMSILDLSDITSDRKADKWDHQKLFVETLKNISMICNCHIIFVAHPRKAMGFLRLDDVGGSGSLGNLVDNAFIVHRKNSDFQKGYDSNFGKGKCDRKFNSLVDNVIEVVKERETGMQDVFIPLYYEQSTRRLKNDMDERIVYGWDSDGFIGEWLEPDQDLPFH
jgi:archaellum biogenesis ATPase FlaH